MRVFLLLLLLSISLAQKDVIVQLFEWNWVSVGRECVNFLGPHGYGYAQVSPPQEHIKGSQWWTSYQPVSSEVSGKRGTRDQFKKMVQDCNGAGVKIIVDAVLNHMAAVSGRGVDGHDFTNYNYPFAGYNSKNFHYCGTKNNAINNYKNKTEVWTCQLSGLSDLQTDTAYVQKKHSAYLSDLMSMGVAGFRLDAAKHMDPNNIKAFVKPLQNYPFLTQEVIFGAGEAVQPSMYTDLGHVMVFQASKDLKKSFESSGIANLIKSGKRWGQSWGNGYLPSDKSNVFVVDHDTERDGSTLSYRSANNAFVLAHIFLLGYDYSVPTVYSGYSFNDFNEGAPGGEHVNDVQCGNVWRCDHRQIGIANMVGFHNAVKGQQFTNAVSNGNQAIAFSRGNVGFVAINNGDQTWNAVFHTGLPAGKYCDIIHSQNSSNSACSGKTFSVDNTGAATVVINKRDAVAFYVQSNTHALST